MKICSFCGNTKETNKSIKALIEHKSGKPIICNICAAKAEKLIKTSTERLIELYPKNTIDVA